MIKIDGLYHEYKKESGESIETLKNINIEIKKGNLNIKIQLILKKNEIIISKLITDHNLNKPTIYY